MPRRDGARRIRRPIAAADRIDPRTPNPSRFSSPGRGRRLFDNLLAEKRQLRLARSHEGDGVLHLRYQVAAFDEPTATASTQRAQAEVCGFRPRIHPGLGRTVVVLRANLRAAARPGPTTNLRSHTHLTFHLRTAARVEKCACPCSREHLKSRPKKGSANSGGRCNIGFFWVE